MYKSVSWAPIAVKMLNAIVEFGRTIFDEQLQMTKSWKNIVHPYNSTHKIHQYPYNFTHIKKLITIVHVHATVLRIFISKLF